MDQPLGINIPQEIEKFGNRRKILIVEDESLISWSLAHALAKAGFEITVADCGEKAIDQLRSGRFDLVITDMKLPHINGFEVAATAKATIRNIPVIMVSALDITLNKEKSIHIDQFIEKPFELKQMTSVIKRVLGRDD